MSMEYQIVRASNIADLESKVRKLIGEGWEPLGGAAIVQLLADHNSRSNVAGSSTLYDSGTICAQAMIRRLER